MFWKKKKPPQKPSRDDIIKNAHGAMSAKREEIGNESLEAIRAAIMKKENSAAARAQNEIKGADVDKVLDNLNVWLRDKE